MSTGQRRHTSGLAGRRRRSLLVVPPLSAIFASDCNWCPASSSRSRRLRQQQQRRRPDQRPKHHLTATASSPNSNVRAIPLARRVDNNPSLVVLSGAAWTVLILLTAVVTMVRGASAMSVEPMAHLDPPSSGDLVRTPEASTPQLPPPPSVVPALSQGGDQQQLVAPISSSSSLEQLQQARLFAAAAAAAATTSDEECPAGCLCKWSGGKQTAECGAAELSEVPEGLSRDTQVLNLSGNPIAILSAREFYRKGYSSLQRIYASRCGLAQVAPSAFHLLTNLVELDLSANQLDRIPSSALSDCSALRRLSLSHNPIEILHNDAFRGLSRLGTLELNHCRLVTVESLAFRGLRSLEFLRMAHNVLRGIPPSALIEHLPAQLYGVNLEENPWTCDCEMRQVRQWMEENNIPLSAPPKCAQPQRLQGISWQALELADFACPPELIAVEPVATAIEADNATLRCEVEAQPPSGTTIGWAVNGRPIKNMSLISFGRQLYVIREEESLGRVKASLLTIVNTFVKDSGSYTCVATNRAGNVSGHATLHVYPREEFGPLTPAEIGGVVLGFLLTLVVLVGAVYMVMQQYQNYCQQRAASAGGALDGHADRALKGVQDNGHQPLKEKGMANGALKMSSSSSCTKPSYETVVSLTRNSGHVGVDLVNSTNNAAAATTAPFTELRTPPERPHNPGSEGGSSTHSVMAAAAASASASASSQQQVPSLGDVCRPAKTTTTTTTASTTTTARRADQTSPVVPVRGQVSGHPVEYSTTSLSAFEKNNANLVNAIATELEEKIANRVIENLNLRNRQTLGIEHRAERRRPRGEPRPLSGDLDDHIPPPPPAPKETTSAKCSRDLIAATATLKPRLNGSVSARVIQSGATGGGGLGGSGGGAGGGGGGSSSSVVGGVMAVAHPAQANAVFHLDPRGESRDSPDEGLGDERDYETDEGPHT